MAGLCIGITVMLLACDARNASTGPTAAVDCREPGVTKDQIKLGLLYPDTGNVASLFLPFRAGVDARLGVVNSAGGINGRKITYTWRDDESQTTANLAAARALVDTDDVFGIIESTSVASGSAAFLHDRGIPVTGTSLETAWTIYDNMFSYSNLIANNASITTWGDFVAAHGGHSAVVAQAAFSATSLSFADELTASLRSAGVRVIGNLDVTGPIDAADVGRRIKASGADVLVGAVTAISFGQVVAAARAARAGLRIILSPTGYDQNILRTFGDALAGVYIFVDYTPFETGTPAHQEFLRAVPYYAPQLQPPNQQAALSGWISADMFLRGLADAGYCPTRQRFITALRGVHDYNAHGLLPAPVDFATGFGQLNRCYTFLQVSSDGSRFQPVPPTPLCGSRLG